MKGPTPDSFRANAEHALQDATLQHALGRAQSGFVAKRAHAIAMVDDFEQLKQRAQAAKSRALANLAPLLEQFEASVVASGGSSLACHSSRHWLGQVGHGALQEDFWRSWASCNVLIC